MEGYITDINAQYNVDKLHEAPASDYLYNVSITSWRTTTERERASPLNQTLMTFHTVIRLHGYAVTRLYGYTGIRLQVHGIRYYLQLLSRAEVAVNWGSYIDLWKTKETIEGKDQQQVLTSMKVKVKRWHGVAVWKWEIVDEDVSFCFGAVSHH